MICAALFVQYMRFLRRRNPHLSEGDFFELFCHTFPDEQDESFEGDDFGNVFSASEKKAKKRKAKKKWLHRKYYNAMNVEFDERHDFGEVRTG